MAIQSRQNVSVTTTPTRLDVAGTDDYFPGDKVLIVAQGAGTLLLGGSGVTAGSGCRVPVVTGTKISVDLDQSEQLWGLVAGGTLAIDILVSGA